MHNLKKLFAITLFTITLLSTQTLFAQSPSDDLTTLLLNMKTMQADFKQKVQEGSSARSLQSAQGKVSLERPGKFRWEITSPNTQITIVNGNKLWIYDVDLQQVTINTFKQAANSTPALLLSDKDLTLSKDFEVKLLPVTSQIAGAKTFMLTPLDKDNSFASIKLSFRGNTLTEMQLRDKVGHRTTIAFRNVKTGMTLSNSLFVFKPQGHVDVIDETKDKR